MHFKIQKSVSLFNRECLVVCTAKSFPKSKVTGAFNAKKAGYIIFENTLENNSALRFAYKKATGRDLEIKQLSLLIVAFLFKILYYIIRKGAKNYKNPLYFLAIFNKKVRL